MDIAEVARRSGIPASTLRFYEEKGLIASVGRQGLRRRFAPGVLDQLALIALGRASGFSLDEIGRMFSPTGQPAIDRGLLVARAEEIDARVRRLKALSDGLRHAAVCPAPSHAECPTFQRLLRAAAAGARERRAGTKPARKALPENSAMQQRHLGPFTVTAIGLGCMNLSHAYGTPPSPDKGREVLHAALDAGVTLFDTAALYGFGANEKLVGPVLKPHRSEITLCSKGGMAGVPGDDGVVRRVIDGRPEAIRRDCENSLRNLQTDVIDLYYLHRWDKKVPIEESVGALSRLVEQGKIRTIGLSEVSAATIRKAHAVHPVTAVQTEYSLWTRNPEIAVLATCRELGITFVPFSPVARGFLCDAVHDVAAFDAKDIRKAMPRFAPDNHAQNLKLLPGYKALAQEAGCTPAQLALAWLLHQGEDLVPIPGTTNPDHLREDLAAADVQLSPDLLARVGAHISHDTVHGNRYGAQSRAEVDTEEFPGD